MTEVLTGNGVLPDYITFSNAQRKSGLSRNGFRKLVREHNIQMYRLSERILLLRLADVQALLEGATAQTA